MRNVEKVWRNLCKSLRESCGEKCGKLWIKKFSTKYVRVFHKKSVIVEKFYQVFTHNVTDVRSEFYTVSTGLTNTTIILG